MKSFRAGAVYSLLFLYIATSFTYQVVASVSLIVGYFDLRHQIREPFEVDYAKPVVTKVNPPAEVAGMRVGDRIEAINGVPYAGRAVWQRARWYARSAQAMRVDVRRKDGSQATFLVSPTGYAKGALANDTLNQVHIGEATFVILAQIVVPFFCLLLGYWVTLARPLDLHAWCVLILLSFPEAYISVSTYNWWPSWLALRLNWHITLIILTPVALLWLGLLFPERSRIDMRLPWLKWLLAAVLVGSVSVALALDYSAWYDLRLIPNTSAIDHANDRVTNWTIVFCLVLYWISIFDQLRAATTADARRRLRVLCIGSVVGLGSLLIIWGALPWFGIADPSGIQWLGYVSVVLMLAFPLSLAYVVVVQRAMDVRILLRMGTKYALARGAIRTVRTILVLVILFLLWQTARQSSFGPVAAVRLAVLGLLLLLISPRVFHPLSVWIDRRFFREAYDVELVLSELSEQVRQFRETAPLIETVTRRISEVLHVAEIGVLLRSSDSFLLRYAMGIPAARPLLLSERSSSVEYLAQVHRPAVLYRENPAEWFRGADDEEKRALEEMRAELLLALSGRERLMGIMALGAKKSEEPYSPSDMRLLQSVALQTGLVLEVSELAHSLAAEAAQRARVTREIEIAREVQERLFPQEIPQIAGLSLAGACRPARGVGGDYYDFIPLEDGRLAIAVGDVSGKGVSAALLMAGLRACLRTMTLVGEMDLATLMEKMNRLVYESSALNRYATFFFAIYDPSTRAMEYVNAGHNPPFLLRGRVNGDAPFLRLEAGGPVIGLLPHASYEKDVLVLQPGEVLLAYTDGISEAMEENDEEWGEERMLLAAEAGSACNADDILRRVFAAADQFTGTASQHDDMTLVVLKIQ
jgi:phosphoserine phosphatase RsbU/P